jgi:hypothetical protein
MVVSTHGPKRIYLALSPAFDAALAPNRTALSAHLMDLVAAVPMAQYQAQGNLAEGVNQALTLVEQGLTPIPLALEAPLLPVAGDPASADADTARPR